MDLIDTYKDFIIGIFISINQIYYKQKLKKMKKLLLFSVLFIIVNLSWGQNYNFKKTNVKDKNPGVETMDAYLSYVYLYDRGEMLIGGPNRNMYYNGICQWANLYQHTVDCRNQTLVDGIYTSNGIFAVDFAIDSINFYLWDNDIENWQLAGVRPEIFLSMEICVPNENNIFLFGNKNDSLKIWLYEDNNFELIASLAGYKVKKVCVGQNDEILFVAKNENNRKLFRLENKHISELFSFPQGQGNITDICRFNNTFFLLNTKGDVYKWDNSLMNMTLLFDNNNGCNQEKSIVALSEDKLMVSGKQGIAVINNGAKNMFVTPDDTTESYEASASYGNRCVFVSNKGTIFEIEMPNKTHDIEAIEKPLRVYPIPATNKITVDFPVLGINNKKIEIYNNLGQLVGSKVFSELSSEIDISDLVSGIYFVRLSDEKTGKVIAKKFVKQ